MPDIHLMLHLTASLESLPKGFVLNEGASVLERFTLTTLTLRGKVGKRTRLVTVKLTEVK